MLNDKSIKFNTILYTTVIKMFNLEKNIIEAKRIFNEMFNHKQT